MPKTRRGFPGPLGLIWIAVMAAAAMLSAQSQFLSGAQTPGPVEELSRLLPYTLDTGGVRTPLVIDPYRAEDPADIWNEWRSENYLDTDPPLLVIRAHDIWARLHYLLPREAAEDLASQWASVSEGERDSFAVVGSNEPIAAPVPGEDAEVSISVDPNNPQHIVASCNHRLLYDPSCTSSLSVSGVTLYSNGGQEVYWSQDGGATWSRQCAPWPSTASYTLTSSNGSSVFTFQSSDPSVAWDLFRQSPCHRQMDRCDKHLVGAGIPWHQLSGVHRREYMHRLR